MDQPVTDHKARRRPFGRLAAAASTAAALLAVVALAATSAGAAPQSVSFALSGSLQIGSQPSMPYPAGSGFTADVDTTTGAITNGHVTIPALTLGPPALPVDVDITISDSAPSTGQIDGSGNVTLTSHLLATITIPSVPGVSCELGPINVPFESDAPMTGSLAGGNASVTLSATGFSVPAIVVSATCPDAVVGLANQQLGLPTTETSSTITVTQTSTPITLPPASTTTTTKLVTTLPAAVTPTFTG